MGYDAKVMPFPRGLASAEDGATIDTADPVYDWAEGWTFVAEDRDPDTGALRSNLPVLLMCVRNNSGWAILPGRQVVMDTATAGKFGSSVIGMNVVAAGFGPVADDRMPAAGCPNNGLFYVVIEGPVLMKTAMASLVAIGLGDRVVGVTTAATSGSTTAGRVQAFDATGATLPLANQVANFIGYALTARTTNNTDSNILVRMRNTWG